MDEKFTIFNMFSMLGGLAFFLYGMNVMSTGLGMEIDVICAAVNVSDGTIDFILDNEEE